MQINLQNIGTAVQKKRGSKGIREVAGEIGISSATLSRIENGKLPDINTLVKLCKWLDVPTDNVLGVHSASTQSSVENRKISAHFKAEQTLSPTAAKALADLILAAQNTFGNTKC